MLRKWYDLVMQNKDDLATIITWENGKPLADAHTEVVYAASFLEWFAEEAPRIYGDVIPVTNSGNRVVTQKMPVGMWSYILRCLIRCRVNTDMHYPRCLWAYYTMELSRCHDYAQDCSSHCCWLHHSL